MCAAYIFLRVCVCMCMCSRCCFLSTSLSSYVGSLNARHNYHCHISNPRPSVRFKLQSTSTLSSLFVPHSFCAGWCCFCFALWLRVSCAPRQFVVHFISLHLISQIPNRTAFAVVVTAARPHSPLISSSFISTMLIPRAARFSVRLE